MVIIIYLGILLINVVAVFMVYKFLGTDMEKKEATKTGELCPECGSELVIRNGKYGSFTACSNYPSCKYIKKSK